MISRGFSSLIDPKKGLSSLGPRIGPTLRPVPTAPLALAGPQQGPTRGVWQSQLYLRGPLSSHSSSAQAASCSKPLPSTSRTTLRFTPKHRAAKPVQATNLKLFKQVCLPKVTCTNCGTHRCGDKPQKGQTH